MYYCTTTYDYCTLSRLPCTLIQYARPQRTECSLSVPYNAYTPVKDSRCVRGGRRMLSRWAMSVSTVGDERAMSVCFPASTERDLFSRTKTNTKSDVIGHPKRAIIVQFLDPKKSGRNDHFLRYPKMDVLWARKRIPEKGVLIHFLDIYLDTFLSSIESFIENVVSLSRFITVSRGPKKF